MSSTFVYFEDISQKSKEYILDEPPKSPIWLQFVTGKVTSVITEGNSMAASGDGDTNCVMAKPHVGSDLLSSGTSLSDVNSKRYIPLLRGISDTPVKGDQVLLCTFGDIDYYIGPINTSNNPNFNPDFPSLVTANNSKAGDGKINLNASTETSKNFYVENIPRLQKSHIPILDNPQGKGTPFIKNNTISNPTSLDDIHGDLVLEGRHGNSIRIGSRGKNPYMMFSNGRIAGQKQESTLDGSIIGIFEYGTLRQHFFKDVTINPSTKKSELYEFTLADDEFKLDGDGQGQSKRSISKTYTKSYGRGFPEYANGSKNDKEDDKDIDKTVYGYNGNQILMSSNRITFNAKKDSIFASALEHIHLGAGKSITFSTSGNYVGEVAGSTIFNTSTFKVDAETITLTCNGGTVENPGKVLLGTTLKGDSMHPAVDGDMLRELMLNLISMMQLGNQQIAAGIAAKNAAGLVGKALTKQNQMLEDFKDDLKNMLCPHISVENGRTKRDDPFEEKFRKKYELTPFDWAGMI